MAEIIGLGELLIDFACTGNNEDGYPTMSAHPGGAPANFLAAVAKFGATAGMIGKVGNDAFGNLLIGTLKKANIDVSGIVVAEDVFTTLAFVTFNDAGDRSFSFARKPGSDTRLTFAEVNLPLIDGAKVLHFGTLSLTDEPAKTATYKAVSYAKSKGKLITFDPNLRKPLWRDLDECKKQMLWGLQQADVVKISDEEVEFLFDLDVESGARHILNTYGVKLVFVTCGAEGCFFSNAVASGKVPSLSGIQVIDTTGAGDIFGGSAVCKLLQTGKNPAELTEKQLLEITTFACTAAGLSTTKSGGISSVPTLDEVQSYLLKSK